jgi:hypothetical protein
VPFQKLVSCDDLVLRLSGLSCDEMGGRIGRKNVLGFIKAKRKDVHERLSLVRSTQRLGIERGNVVVVGTCGGELGQMVSDKVALPRTANAQKKWRNPANSGKSRSEMAGGP